MTSSNEANVSMSDKKINFPILDICTLSETRDEDFLVSKFGAYLERHKNLHHAHRHSFYHLVFFTQGAGFHTIDFGSFVSPKAIPQMSDTTEVLKLLNLKNKKFLK